MIGASQAAWQGFTALGLTADLLPVVADMSVPMASYSKLTAAGKVPSMIDSQGFAHGLSKWTTRISTDADVARWSADDRLGICLQTRTARAIDIDIDDPILSLQIMDAIAGALDGIALPIRERANPARKLLLFRYAAPMTKRVIPVGTGLIEFLGDGQQAVVAGQHPSGERYSWEGRDAPTAIPMLTDDDLQAVWSTLIALFSTAPARISQEKRQGTGFEGSITDSHAAWLLQNWDCYTNGDDGRIFLRCPFDDEHTTDSGESATAYFPAGTGGYERGHWRCQHSHCAERSDHDFQVKTGYIGGSFTALPERVMVPRNSGVPDDFLPREGASNDPLALEATEDLILPAISRDKGGSIIVNADNINKLLSTPTFTGMSLGYDTFRGAIMWAPAWQEQPQWREFVDNDYVNLEIAFIRRQIDPPGHDTLRRWVRKAAADRAFDSAQEWLGRLKWDGVPRIDRFLSTYLGVAHDNHGYDVAVSRYIWTALAGRVMVPGVQADMVPILYGDQGARKTSAIRALVPSAEFYATIDMSQRDEDTARLMRGTLVNELEELRGLRSRDAEAIKAWITKSADKWTPKYVEFASTYQRRSVFFGTTNKDDFLDDPTGERRWLPFTVGQSGPIDIEALVRDREQLWAEGALLFAIDGVQWRDAERLATAEQLRFKADDDYVTAISRWLDSAGLGDARPRDHLARTADGLTNHDIAVGIGAAHGKPDRGVSTSIGIAMRKMGFTSRQLGVTRTRTWFEAV